MVKFYIRICMYTLDDLTGWQDSVLKELERKHTKERNLLLDLLQESDSEDFKQEAREMSMDERNKRLTTLKAKRDALDLSIKCKKLIKKMAGKLKTFSSICLTYTFQ